MSQDKTIKNNKNQKGVSLYLALMIMGALLSLALGINALLLGQAKTLKGIGHSVMAFYAADSGIEEVIYVIRKGGGPYTCPLITPDEPCGAEFSCTDLANSASYNIIIQDCQVPGNVPTSIDIDSIGKYKDTSRAINITY